MILDLPKSLKAMHDHVTGTNYNVNPIQFSIYGSPVPQISVPPIDVVYGGQVYKASSGSRPAYDPLTVKFLIDNGYKNYWALWNWLNLFNDAEKSSSNITTVPIGSQSNSDLNRMNNPMSDYTANFTISGLDEFNNKIISFLYTHAFPTNLAEISFDNQNPAEITSTVSFAFNQLKVDLVKDVNQVTC
jgi:hypothetical protein